MAAKYARAECIAAPPDVAPGVETSKGQIHEHRLVLTWVWQKKRKKWSRIFLLCCKFRKTTAFCYPCSLPPSGSSPIINAMKGYSVQYPPLPVCNAHSQFVENTQCSTLFHLIFRSEQLKHVSLCFKVCFCLTFRKPFNALFFSLISNACSKKTGTLVTL